MIEPRNQDARDREDSILPVLRGVGFIPLGVAAWFVTVLIVGTILPLTISTGGQAPPPKYWEMLRPHVMAAVAAFVYAWVGAMCAPVTAKRLTAGLMLPLLIVLTRPLPRPDQELPFHAASCLGGLVAVLALPRARARVAADG